MKRQNFLFDRIADRGNIRLAFLKTLRGNRSSLSAISYCRDIDKNLETLRGNLLSPNFKWGGYRSFLITDPKQRVISTAPFEQRVMHHAIMNVLEPIMERSLICHSYACRKGKGTHAAVRYAFARCRASPHFLKLDVRKYFDSVDHGVLKSMLRRLIKDMRVIDLLDGVIDGYETALGKGVPIGNLTSQFFANLYLSGMDHHVLEKLRPRAYCRYMDDFVAWSSSKKQLKDMFARVADYVGDNLKLELKPPVFGDAASGLPFLGFLVKENGVYLMQKSKRRVRDRMAEISVSLGRGETTQEKAAERIRSVFAVIGMARTYRFRKKLCEKWGPAAGDSRVKRGGSWNNTPANVRSAHRNNTNPDNRNNNLGFRLVRP